MPTTQRIRIAIVLVLLLLLLKDVNFTLELHPGRFKWSSHIETVVFEDMNRAFRSIRLNPADIYVSVFSNPGMHQSN